MVCRPQSSASSQANGRGLFAKLFYVGVAVYVVSFFLTATGSGNDVHSGWNCALVALFAWALPQGTNMDPHIAIGMRLSGFGGLINPLAIAYAILRYGSLKVWRCCSKNTSRTCDSRTHLHPFDMARSVFHLYRRGGRLSADWSGSLDRRAPFDGPGRILRFDRRAKRVSRMILRNS